MSFRSSIPLMVVDSLRSRHREFSGLLLFDVMMMVTYGSGFKARYAHPWPLPLQNITTDKL